MKFIFIFCLPFTLSLPEVEATSSLFFKATQLMFCLSSKFKLLKIKRWTFPFTSIYPTRFERQRHQTRPHPSPRACDHAMRHRTAIPKWVLEQPPWRHLCLHHFRGTAIQFKGQVWFWHGLAELFQTNHTRQYRGKKRRIARYGTRRSALSERQLPPGPRLSRWPRPNRTPLLY